MDPDLPIRPREIPREEFLDPHRMNPQELAKRLDVPSFPIAQPLDHACRPSDTFSANLQTRCELDRATIGAARDGRATDRPRRADAPRRELQAATS